MLTSATRHQIKRVSFQRLVFPRHSSTSTTDEQPQELADTTKRQQTNSNSTDSVDGKKCVPVPTTTFLSASEIVSNPPNATSPTPSASTSATASSVGSTSTSTLVEQIIIDEINYSNSIEPESITKDKSSISTMKKKKYLISSLPRVPSTDNIPKNKLLLDMLMSNYSPLTTPLITNHTRSPVSLALEPKLYKNQKISSKQTSILDNLDKFKKCKQELKDLEAQRYKNYNPYFTNTNMKSNSNIININLNHSSKNGFNDGRNGYNSIFTNSVLNTQQHNTELFNLPLHYLEKLKPFQILNKPGDEHYRDDSIVVRKIEIEEKDLKQKEIRMEKFRKNLEDAKNGVFKGGKFEINDIHEYFGFK